MAINNFPQIATVLPGSLGNLVVVIGDLVKVIGAVDRFGWVEMIISTFLYPTPLTDAFSYI